MLVCDPLALARSVKNRLIPLLWTRPSGRSEWAFLVLLAMMAVGGLAWILIQGAEGTRALGQWFAVLGGETELKLKTRDYMAGSFMLTAWIWLFTAVALWLSRSWWWKRPAPLEPGTRRVLIDRGFVIGIGLILLLALFIRWPRMDLSLYNDEIDVFRTSIEGGWQGKEFLDVTNDELPRFRHIPWIDTIWGNRIGNNHALHSILARITYEIWHGLSGSPEGTIEEWPIRFPPLVLGLVSLVAVAALARLITGSLRAAWIVAFLVAIHPWHVRYSTEARGYAMVFGFGALAVLFLSLAIRRGGWRWWLGFGAAQMATLWSCTGTLHLLVGINLVTAAALLWPRRDASTGKRFNPLQSPALPCWIVANVLSACLYLPTTSSTLPPLRLAIETNATFSQGVVGQWWRDITTYFLVGMPWTDGDPESPVVPSMTKYFGQPLVTAGFLLAIALTTTGAWRLVRQGGFPGRLAVLGPALGVFLLWFASKVGGSTALIWYGNFGTVFVTLWMGIGLHGWIYARADDASSESPGRDRRIWQRLATYALLGLYTIAVARPLLIYREHGKQAMKDAIILARGGVFPFTEEQRRPLVAGWWTHANFYDPYLRIAHTPEALDTLIQRSRDEKRPLFFILGARQIALAEDPRVIERLENPEEFEVEAVLPGLEENQFRTWIFRFRG